MRIDACKYILCAFICAYVCCMYVVCHSLGMGGVFVCFAFALEIFLVYEVGVMLNYKV